MSLNKENHSSCPVFFCLLFLNFLSAPQIEFALYTEPQGPTLSFLEAEDSPKTSSMQILTRSKGE